MTLFPRTVERASCTMHLLLYIDEFPTILTSVVLLVALNLDSHTYRVSRFGLAVKR